MSYMVNAQKVELDPLWMGALGFSFIASGKIAFVQWRNEKYGLQVRDDINMVELCRRLEQAIVNKTVNRQQDALREFLLPAMGLCIQHTRDDWGSIQTSFVAPE